MRWGRSRFRSRKQYLRWIKESLKNRNLVQTMSDLNFTDPGNPPFLRQSSSPFILETCIRCRPLWIWLHAITTGGALCCCSCRRIFIMNRGLYSNFNKHVHRHVKIFSLFKVLNIWTQIRCHLLIPHTTEKLPADCPQQQYNLHTTLTHIALERPPLSNAQSFGWIWDANRFRRKLWIFPLIRNFLICQFGRNIGG